ncbi:hypothetical protein EMIHUDRAFT_225733 [Emiliania huxleyi CCMP1516]|uniref:Uncharacterized protein n=2 Tax=Emiliania huxleyi TaxID=2903 RepID=A0A0D3KNE6_EMIH1|nr:hypothetical protein EMIHUDRAFT_225733 [Emiliania huxleyi CCMP1516]EOD37281.1 hypothetical protein EMIHUDRAFT_225733 [Emiliania huxleyi CCMP1516]|eukprot:XP_005789710.1 hypothetical protein EMIHUDRAFT_225733 [Emiliania huxleyi CCMP1516]
MLYTVSDVPPAYLGVILGFQHYLTMLGATALIPLLIVPEMGGTPTQMAEVICTIFFVSGCNTLLQTTIGDRLPIVQGGSFAFLSPTFAVIGQVRAMVASGEIGAEEQFEQTMRRIQGAILTCGFIQVALGYSGVLGLLTRFISPLTIAPTVCMVGLGLYTAPNINGNFQRPLPVPGCEGYAAAVIICMVVFSQLLGFVNLKIGGASIKIFALFPVLWTVMVAWGIGAIAQAAGGMDDDYLGGRYAICKTSSQVIEDSKWFRWPYPGQWGAPIFDKCAILPMIAAMLVSMVESIGDYYAAAQLAGAPPPSGPVISRGLAGEGRVWGLILCGLIGTGNGTTSYGENIGALGVTKVGSRAVVQAGACTMIFMGCFPKFGAVFAAMPGWLVGGLYMCLFGLICSCGLAQLQHVDLNSSRNLFILGFCIYNGLSLGGDPSPLRLALGGPAGYFANTGPWGEPNTMIVSLLAGVLLDNLIPGTRAERGAGVYHS